MPESSQPVAKIVFYAQPKHVTTTNKTNTHSNPNFSMRSATVIHLDTFLRPPFCCGTSGLDFFTAPEVVAVTLVVAVAVVVATAMVVAVALVAVAAETVEELVAAPVAVEADTVQELVAAPVAAAADDTAAVMELVELVAAVTVAAAGLAAKNGQG
jgi:hypothetical protein